MIEQDFYSLIKPLPLVEQTVGDRIYYGLADQDNVLPIIVLSMEGQERQYSADKKVCQNVYTVSVSIFAGDYMQARTLQETIVTALETQEFGQLAHQPLLTGVSMFSEKKDDASDANIHHIELRFEVYADG
jgi:hypothetical protein